MYRTTVIRAEENGNVNVNDEIGLDSFESYTLAQHLEDLASEGKRLVSAYGEVHLFEGDEVMLLKQRREPIDLDALDEETQDLLLGSAAMLSMPQFALAPLAVC